MAVAACLLAVPFLALWLSHVGDAGVETFEPATASEPSAVQTVVDMPELVTELDLWSAGVIDSIDETSVSLHYYTGPYDSAEPLLRELEFSPGTLDRISNTQAIDGTLTATAPQATASWSYDADEGMSIVIQLTD